MSDTAWLVVLAMVVVGTIARALPAIIRAARGTPDAPDAVYHYNVAGPLFASRSTTTEPANQPLKPGDVWTAPDGKAYDVVRAEYVGDRPRWWFSPEFAHKHGGPFLGRMHTGENSMPEPGDLALVVRTT